MAFFGNVRQQKLLSFTLLVFTLSLGIVIGTLVNTGVWAARAQNPAPDAAPLVIPPPRQSGNELAKLVKSIEPAVVNISMDYVTRPVSAKKRGPQPPSDDDESDDSMDLFRRFFRGMPDAPQRPYRGGGTGSGFVVDKNGYIITNNHVVEKADHIKVKFPHDQTEYRAKLIGTDEETDIAVIKIDTGKPLQTLKIGNSDGVAVGDAAIAIGSPFGLEASVTSGIVSATGRDIGGNKQFQRFIQTDAAINPGNSGGPLLNQWGEVIGVNTLIATQSGGYQGIGFALPSNTAVSVYNAIIKSGRVSRGSIGITFQKVQKQQELMKALGLKEGVIVESVVEGQPAAKAGLKEGDVIVAFNGKPVKDGDDLVANVSQTPVGAKATVTIDRNGQRMEKTLTIGDREEVANIRQGRGGSEEKEPGEEPSQGESTQQSKFGIRLRALTEAEHENTAFAEYKGGVVVTQVTEGSFADDIGIQEKDVIVSINRKPVTTVEDVRKVQSTLKPGDAVAFRILRGFTSPGRNGRTATEYQGLWLAGTLPANQ